MILNHTAMMPTVLKAASVQKEPPGMVSGLKIHTVTLHRIVMSIKGKYHANKYVCQNKHG
jgi:hypothetical protein